MKTDTFVYRSRIPASAEDVFNWHARPGAFERLLPPWERVDLVAHSGSITDGARAEVVVRLGPLRKRWVAVHRHYQPGRSFEDVQTAGPFACWQHTHTITPDGPDGCWLKDRIVYAPPLGAAGRLLAGGFIRSRLEQMFAYRHRLTATDIQLHRKLQRQTPMKILVSGRSGLVGSALSAFLTTGGYEVVGLSRSTAHPGTIHWDPGRGVLEASQVEGIDAVVHLAGETISKRWTAAQKARIRDSRVQGTDLLSRTLAGLERPPSTLICASAIGYYGDRGTEILTEASPPGTGFLADVCRQWEAAADPAREQGIRVVNLRLGVVLSPKGGALAKMLTPFKLGGGGVIGRGDQYWSWVSLDDVVGAIHHALATETLSGPVNATSPNPVTNREFTKTLGRVLHRPTLLPVPAFAARLALGEMANELLLGSARVLPQRLQETQYEFRDPELDEALRKLLGR